MLRQFHETMVQFTPSIRLEPFVPISRGLTTRYEVLSILPYGGSAEEYFDTLKHNPSLATAVDLKILHAAFQQLQSANPHLKASFNVFPNTIFSGALDQLLELGIKRESICANWLYSQTVEVLEHSLPIGFDDEELARLRGRYGTNVALDDLKLNVDGRQRIDALGRHVDMFKFHHSVTAGIRDGRAGILEQLERLREKYPNKAFVVEGLRSQDTHLVERLRAIGIDAGQLYTSPDEMRDFAAESDRMALESGWGTLAIA